VEFFVNDKKEPEHPVIYKKTTTGNIIRNNPSKYLIEYLDIQGIKLPENALKKEDTEILM
jgi:hypothetical protein